jgi:Arc/MetJ family transcription regulator
MKMTMHIDETLLDRVMKTHGFSSKTEAVEKALKEMDRKARLKNYLMDGLGLTPEELKASVDPDYDVLGSRAAESAALYGKRSARR